MEAPLAVPRLPVAPEVLERLEALVAELDPASLGGTDKLTASDE